MLKPPKTNLYCREVVYCVYAGEPRRDRTLLDGVHRQLQQGGGVSDAASVYSSRAPYQRKEETYPPGYSRQGGTGRGIACEKEERDQLSRVRRRFRNRIKKTHRPSLSDVSGAG
jgi:hypothetical protein